MCRFIQAMVRTGEERLGQRGHPASLNLQGGVQHLLLLLSLPHTSEEFCLLRPWMHWVSWVLHLVSLLCFGYLLFGLWTRTIYVFVFCSKSANVYHENNKCQHTCHFTHVHTIRRYRPYRQVVVGTHLQERMCRCAVFKCQYYYIGIHQKQVCCVCR